MNADEFEGGDPACWLDRVCAECGAFLEGEASPEGLTCWRCGTVQAPDTER